MLRAGWSDSEPITLITPTWVPSRAATTVTPLPGPDSGRFAGRITRSDAAEVGADLLTPPGVVAERDRVGAGGEEAVGQLRRDPDAVRDVLAVDDADRGIELRPQRRQPVLERLAAGPPDDVADEEDVEVTEAIRQPGARRSRRCCRERARASRAPAARPPPRRRPIRAWRRTRAPGCRPQATDRARDGSDVTISAGAALGRTSIREPYALPSITKSEIETTVPSTGEYTSVPGAAPTSSTSVPGPPSS